MTKTKKPKTSSSSLSAVEPSASNPALLQKMELVDAMSLPVQDAPIQLGCFVRCAITGYHGIASGRVQELNGNVRWIVSAQAGIFEAMPSYMLDECSLDRIGDGVVDRVVPVGRQYVFPGDQVTDLLSNVKGTVESVIFSMNGCIECKVVTARKKDIQSATAMIDQQRLVIRGKLDLPLMEATGGFPQRVVR